MIGLKDLKDIKNKRGGFSLIEFMLVMALGLIAMIVIVPRYQTYSATSEGRASAAKITEFKTYIVANYSGDADYKDLKTTYLSLAPKTFKLNGNKNGLENVWRHPVTVSEKVFAGSQAGFFITNKSVPRGAACIEFVKRSQGSDWNDIRVGTKSVITDQTPTSTILTACAPDPHDSRATIDIVNEYWNQA